MTRRTSVKGLLAIITVVVLGFIAFDQLTFVWTLDFAEAYAAWDTGTLLIEYMESNEGRWPESWDDLLSVMKGDKGMSIMMRGAKAGDIKYAATLRETVSIDWSFNPASMSDGQRPVTRLDGSEFQCVWEGAEPNEMIRIYLEKLEPRN